MHVSKFLRNINRVI